MSLHDKFDLSSFNAWGIVARVIEPYLVISVGGFLITMPLSVDNRAEEVEFFDKMIKREANGRLSYATDDGWWITFWEKESSYMVRVAWWTAHPKGVHEWQVDTEINVKRESVSLQ